ncbi:hypothetical protein BCY84_08545 [Trypanosoma cruzi cruzi]|uniref:Uncharacterized protein n=1 Tax=Trypanosoma cruzi TaxID=5693 RepID=A0A2V2UIJ5_TRYCR|nr:hypothetical protein BCY84_14739 [Trypanosoma cruzi cruzi]PBJ76606.1 hypothetical protein BCY84_08545 [Trypanosoma cruzi cruzi]PWU83820.1 hypothetical protein C4B63_281g7 [Trypanosoma cruzi]
MYSCLSLRLLVGGGMGFASRRRAAMVLSLLVFLLVVPCGVFSQYSLECQNVWEGPNAENDIIACLSNKDRLKGQWRLFILPALNVLILAMLLLSFPLLFLCALCCRCCCTPGTAGSTKRARCCMWLWILYAVIWSGVMFYLVFFGAGLLIATAPRLLEDFVSGPLDYFNSTAERVLDFASDWSTGERKPLDAIPLDLSDFTTVHEQAMGFIALARRYYFDYLDKVSIATFCVSSVGLVLIILILPFACCHCCIPCFPLILSCLYWVTGVLFAVLGTVVSVLAYATTVGCGELELQYTRQPGVFQWYAVPYCQRQFNFSNINKMIREKELELSREACNQLLGVCESVTPGETAAEPMKLLAAGVIPRAIPGVIPAAFPTVPGVAVPGSVPAAVTGVPAVVPGGLPEGVPGAPEGAPGAVPGAATGDSAAIAALARSGALSGNDGAPLDISSLAGSDGVGLAGGASSIEGFEGLPPGIDLSSIKDMPGASESIKKALESRNISEDILRMAPGGLNADLLKMLSNATALSNLFARPLVCGKGLSNASECGDFGTMASILLDTKLQKNIPGCVSKNGNCTLTDCAATCTIDFLKDASTMILSKGEMARNASNALSYARPLLECNFVIDKVATGLAKCDDLRKGTIMLGMGFLVGGMIFGLAIYIALRGACVWGETFPKLRRKPREE